MLAPATAPTLVMQDRVARPATWIVQAPHKPIPQPNLVPLRPTSSRMAQSNGASSGVRTETARPLISKLVMIAGPGTSRSWRGRLVTDRRDLALETGPSWAVGARASQVGRDPGDLGVGETGIGGHHETGTALPNADAAQHHLDEIGRVRQREGAVERKFRTPGQRGWRSVVMASDASGRVKRCVGVVFPAAAETGGRQRLRDR